MTTALSIITSAMQKAGIITKNESPSSDEASDALVALNDLLSSWSTESTSIVAPTLEDFPFTGATSYTIGVGGDFNTTQPVQIIRAYARNGTLDYDMTQITQENYTEISLKSLTGVPDLFTYDNAYPLGTLKFYPVPLSDYRLYILSEKPITAFSTLSTDISLPAGWRRALVYNLAIDLAPEYGQAISGDTAGIARQAKGHIARQIIKARSKNNSAAVQGNIYSGWWR